MTTGQSKTSQSKIRFVIRNISSGEVWIVDADFMDTTEERIIFKNLEERKDESFSYEVASFPALWHVAMTEEQDNLNFEDEGEETQGYVPFSTEEEEHE